MLTRKQIRDLARAASGRGLSPAEVQAAEERAAIARFERERRRGFRRGFIPHRFEMSALVFNVVTAAEMHPAKRITTPPALPCPASPSPPRSPA
jgi:hypothetical protein